MQRRMSSRGHSFAYYTCPPSTFVIGQFQLVRARVEDTCTKRSLQWSPNLTSSKKKASLLHLVERIAQEICSPVLNWFEYLQLQFFLLMEQKISRSSKLIVKLTVMMSLPCFVETYKSIHCFKFCFKRQYRCLRFLASNLIPGKS